MVPSLQEAVQLLLNPDKRILPQVIDASLLPLPPFLLRTQCLDLFFEGNLGDGDGQVHLGKTSPQEMVLEKLLSESESRPGHPPGGAIGSTDKPHHVSGRC